MSAWLMHINKYTFSKFYLLLICELSDQMLEFLLGWEKSHPTHDIVYISKLTTKTVQTTSSHLPLVMEIPSWHQRHFYIFQYHTGLLIFLEPHELCSFKFRTENYLSGHWCSPQNIPIWGMTISAPSRKQQMRINCRGFLQYLWRSLYYKYTNICTTEICYINIHGNSDCFPKMCFLQEDDLIHYYGKWDTEWFLSWYFWL